MRQTPLVAIMALVESKAGNATKKRMARPTMCIVSKAITTDRVLMPGRRV